MNIDTLTMEQFKRLPLVIEGESKEIRYAGKGKVVIRLKPTIYSYTHNRSGNIPHSDTERLRSIKALLPVLRASGIQHTYEGVNEKWILSKLVLQPPTTTEPKPFRPDDITPEMMAHLPVAPPVEVVAKRVHSGTPKHRYYEFDAHSTRHGQQLAPDMPYPETIIRFDWRNPLIDANGIRLADEVLPEPMANWFIDVEQATKTAQRAYDALYAHLATKNLDLWDICFFVTQDGSTIFGEVSPDCLRVRAANGTSLDKDVWRKGGSSDDVISKWKLFNNRLLEKPL